MPFARYPLLLTVAAVLAFGSPASAQDTGAVQGMPEAQAQMGSGQLELRPGKGPVNEDVRIIGKGLPVGVQVSVLGGQDPAKLMPMGNAGIDTAGNLAARVSVPEVPYGSTFYFAVKIGEEVSPPLAYLVEARQPDPTAQ
jgi:hypothetical protein